MPYKITYEQAEQMRARFKEKLPKALADGRPLREIREELCTEFGLTIRTVDNILAGNSHKRPRPVNKRKHPVDS